LWIQEIANRKKKTIQEALKPLFKKHTSYTIFTDALASYTHLKHKHDHFVMNKKWGFARNSYRWCLDNEKPSVIRVHVNTIENCWMLLRKILRLRSAYTNPDYIMYSVHEFIFYFNQNNWLDLLR
jgi:hypothetical protein